MIRPYFLFLALLLLVGCQTTPSRQTEDLTATPWSEISETAKGETVTWMMWQGDPLINRYVADYLAPAIKEHFDITLEVVPGQGNQIVSQLTAELEAGKESSEIDMMWINGETFFQLRQINGLYGPFVQQLPNNELIDWDNPFIHTDFQQPVDGFECPWGNVQLAIIYNSDQVEEVPQTLEDLEKWVTAHPGKFTIGSDFTGMTLLKSWLIHLAGGPGSLDGPFNEEKYLKASQEMWTYLNRIKGNFWNHGTTFPTDVAQMHQLFVNGELWFTMSNNDTEVDNKINQGFFPESSRAYVPSYGTIQNTHYLGIAKRSAHKEAAMTVINFMLSPEAQWHKNHPDVWGDGTVLDLKKVPTEWQERFKDVPGHQYSPKRADIQSRALQEPAPEYMIRLFQDFRKYVIEA
ncbi:ABC transporter substrate-binding protein [Pontibacter sp. G13]|uniref:ABC transporter substrate-binding protein n=1 Tax=Pontibacter sp. G13 TaxID=3074898 RepID=UPI00288B6D36|nr:ABC transporter substrate-binding protein [Pontibacter sp. G13]WNJ20012.1 ABC transporter substrate-binding protein [Pontibacter sp. G13]